MTSSVIVVYDGRNYLA